MKYPLVYDSFGAEEHRAMARVIASGQFTMGPEVKAFEKQFAEYVGSKHAVMVNSGSSANLLMVAALVESGQLQPGDRVAVPAVSWSTTYFPLVQYGLRPVFIDVEMSTFNLDIDKLEKFVDTDHIIGVFAVNLLGNPCNFKKLKDLCERKHLVMIEDNCEAFNAKVYDGMSRKHTGTIGLMGSYSTFFSHHLQTMEGGVIVTDDTDLYHILLSLRAHGWVRDLPDKTKLYEKTGDPFVDSFKFVLPGYNVRPLEFSGAIGQVQLTRAQKFADRRSVNADSYKGLFGQNRLFKIQDDRWGLSSWFGFGIILDNELAGKRPQVVKFLTERGIDTRPIVAGNFLNQPVMSRIGPVDCPERCVVADRIDRDGFFLGNDGTTDLRQHLMQVYHLLVSNYMDM